MERTEKHSPASPQNIMHAFKQANNEIAGSKSLDEMIAAYNKVIGFCTNSAECRSNNSIKRNTLLYWAYSNIGSSYRKKNMPLIAYTYYQKALSVAISDQQQIMALESMLTETGKLDLRVKNKCRKIIKLCTRLIKIYQKNDLQEDMQRISALSERMLELLNK